jgi:hypothetical protein
MSFIVEHETHQSRDLPFIVLRRSVLVSFA